MEEFVIKLSENEFDRLIAEEIDFDEILENYIETQDQMATRDGGENFESNLRYFHSSNDGFPETYNLRIEDINFISYELKGNFTINYDITFSHTCDDLTTNDSDYMKYNFYIDREMRKVFCKAEVYPKSTYE